MAINLYNRNIISINDLNKEEILHILQTAKEYKESKESKENKENKSPQDHLQGRVLGTCFFEPSTRTKLSFESAMFRLGGNVIGFNDVLSTSTAKGESLYDAIRVISGYVDAIVIRHPKAGAANRAAVASEVPVINGGDGSNQHPTQTLIDLFTINETQKTLKNLHIAFVGDLKHGRTVHSFIKACPFFKPRLSFVSPNNLRLPQTLCDELRKHSIKFSFHQDIEDVISTVDVLYMTRFQKERYSNNLENIHSNNYYTLTASHLKANIKKNLAILHPLPRVTEIQQDVDKSPHAYYFQQAHNGLYIRQAILNLLLTCKNNCENSLNKNSSAKEIIYG